MFKYQRHSEWCYLYKSTPVLTYFESNLYMSFASYGNSLCPIRNWQKWRKIKRSNQVQTDARGPALKCGLQRQHVMDQVVHLNQKETPPLFREISSSPLLVETAMSPSPSADLVFLKRPSSPVEHSPVYLCSTKNRRNCIGLQSLFARIWINKVIWCKVFAAALGMAIDIEVSWISFHFCDPNGEKTFGI